MNEKIRISNPTNKLIFLNTSIRTDGEVNVGLKFDEVKDLLKFSRVPIYPIAYGEVNQKELAKIASLRESTVQTGTPKNVQKILKAIFQTNL